jgi:hypothetical protein
MAYLTPLFQQNGSYPASEIRALISEAFPGTGVVGSGDLKVTQRGAGANMSVDVEPGRCVIENSTSSRGRYLCSSTTTVNVAISAAPSAGNSRIDLVLAAVSDTEYGDGADTWAVFVLAGTPGSSPSAPSTPAGAIVLARVLVGAEVATITNANITDYRSYAAAVTYTDRTPTDAVDGQVLVDADGIVTVRSDGAWVPQVSTAQFPAGVTTIGSTALTATTTAYGTTTLTQPPGPVNVMADFSGSFVCGSSTNGVIEAIVEISLNGGSTWTAGPTITDLSENTLLPRSISASHLRANVTPSGTVKARVMMRRTTATAVTISTSHVRCYVTPAG